MSRFEDKLSQLRRRPLAFRIHLHFSLGDAGKFPVQKRAQLAFFILIMVQVPRHAHLFDAVLPLRLLDQVKGKPINDKIHIRFSLLSFM